MYNFFVDRCQRQDNLFYIEGSDCNHIKNVLRMKCGDNILVSCEGISSLCIIKDISEDRVAAEITEENYRNTELDTGIYLFQALPKGDKMELIIQKCVELGVHEIIPVEMNRCVVKLDEKKKKSKVSRWQAISESAAKQSKRNFIPVVSDVIPYKKALERAKEMDVLLVPYENERGMKATAEALSKIKKGSSVGIIIGCEGGFEEKEIAMAEEIGGLPVSLGERILRTETAAITATGMCMLYTEMKLSDNND